METMAYKNEKAEKMLFKAGAWTSILFLLYSFITIIIFIVIKEGYPQTAGECFDMIRENRFTALLRLDIVSVVVIPFYYLLFYSIYYALKKEYKLITGIALFCTLAGITMFISGVNIASIIIVSDKYHEATSPELKQQLLAACEGMLASDMWLNTGAIIRGILIETGAFIFSIIMLKTNVFAKITGWTGIFTHGFDLLCIFTGLFYPPIKDIFTMIAGPVYILWFVLIAIGLFKLEKNYHQHPVNYS